MTLLSAYPHAELKSHEKKAECFFFFNLMANLSLLLGFDG